MNPFAASKRLISSAERALRSLSVADTIRVAGRRSAAHNAASLASGFSVACAPTKLNARSSRLHLLQSAFGGLPQRLVARVSSPFAMELQLRWRRVPQMKRRLHD